MSDFFAYSFSTNWVEIYYGSLVNVNSSDPYNVIPIDNLILPKVLEGKLISIYASSNTAKSSWKTGGWIWANVNSGALISNNSYTAQATQKLKFYLNQETILRIPDFIREYKIELSFPHWIADINLEISEYVGSVANSTEEKLDLIYNAILELETGINTGDVPQTATLSFEEENALLLLGGFI